MRRIWLSVLVAISWLGLVFTVGARAGEARLPAADDVLQRVIERAKSKSPDAAGPAYTCTKHTVTEELDSDGNVTERKVNIRQNRSANAGSGAAGKWSNQNGFSLDEGLLRRYQFTVVNREVFRGRPALILMFVPKDPPVPIRRLQDRVLNRAMGTVWVDEKDYDLIKANICLSEAVSFGILGNIQEFGFGFERVRMPDGSWLTEWTDISVKARKLLTPIRLHKRVEWKDFQTATAMNEERRRP